MPYEKIGKEVRCIADEIPFEIPDSWEWVRASSLGTMVRGKGIKRDETLSVGKACIRYGEIYTTYNDVFKETKSFITEELDAQCLHISFGDVVFTLTGENKVDIAKAIAFLGEGNVAAGGDLAYWTEHGMNPLYLVYYMASPFCIDQKRNVATGDIIVHISTGKVGNFLVPVPPLAEQKRIVSKIEELLPHIEEYGKAESKVSKLNAEFPEQLKKSILQWAIQGKLVPQNPEDEPASVLLERIRTEKAKLVKEGKIKKDKNESVIFRRDNSHYTLQGKNEVCIDDKIPFDLPDGWAWCNLQMVTTNIHYGYTASAAPTGNSKLLRITDIQNNAVNWEDVPFCTVTPNELECYQLHNRDIMIARTGGTIGKTYIVRNLNETAVFASYLIRAIPVPHINEEYLKIFMESPFYWKQLKDFSSGTGQPNVNGNSLKNLLLPLPPLEEQERIVQFYFEFLPTVISLTEFSL